MPRIPTIQSEGSNFVGGLDRSYSNAKATPDDFGAQLGRAISNFGDAAGSAALAGARYAQEDQERSRKEHLALLSAQTDLVTPAVNARTNAPADGRGVKDKTIEDQQAIVDKTIADQQLDPKSAQEFRVMKAGEIARTRNSNIEFEATAKANNSKLQADGALNTVYNKLRTDPEMYDEAVIQGNAVIDNSPAVPAAEREAYKQSFSQNAANTRFEGKLAAAKTVAEFRAIEKELTDEKGPWQGRLSADQYKRLNDTITNQTKVLATKQNAYVTSELDAMRTQTDDQSAPPLDPSRLEAVRKTLDQGEPNAVQMLKFSQLARDEAIKRSTRGLPSAELSRLSDVAKGGPKALYPNLPAEMADSINVASRIFPGVSASYLAATATQEYGGQFKKDGKTDYGVKSDTSSATGVYQFIDETWNGVTSNSAVRTVMKTAGYDLDKMTPAQVAELRKDPKASTIGAAALAAQNKIALQDALKRPVSDAELYMAHFMGSDGAARFLQSYATGGENASAAKMMPKAAAANHNVYYDKSGRERTVGEVYNNFVARFSASPSAVAYHDSQTYKGFADSAAKAERDNPIGTAQTNGTHAVVPLDQPGSWESRGATARSIADYYKISNEDLKPLDTVQEVPAIKKQIQDGTPEQIAGVLQNVGKLDRTAPGMSAVALRQLGEKDTAYGVAAQLMQGERPDMATATTVIRGQQRLNKDDSVKTMLGTGNEASDAFNKVTGGALFALDPAAREALRRAAEAHYIETATSGDGKFRAKDFEASINAVMGGKADKPRVGSINGTATVLPAGVTENEMDSAIDNLTPQDLVSRSVDPRGQPNGMAPIYASGENVKPIEIAAEGKLRYVADGVYRVQMSDNRYLVTPQKDQSGGFVPYLMRFDQTAVKELAARRSASLYSFGTGIAP